VNFFLDSANLDEIKQVRQMGLLDGVTTNPSLISKENCSYRELIAEICSLCSGPVSAEVLSMDAEGMKKEAEDLHSIAENIIVKIPLTQAGLVAVDYCCSKKIKTNVTLCFNPLQALAAAKVGATYISPFVGRLDDIGQVGMNCISEIKKIYDNYGFNTKILVASIRSMTHLQQAALIGADVATIPCAVMKKMVEHPLTTSGLDKFMEDSRKIIR
jgi:transaldolase